MRVKLYPRLMRGDKSSRAKSLHNSSLQYGLLINAKKSPCLVLIILLWRHNHANLTLISVNLDLSRCFIFLEEVPWYALFLYQVLQHYFGFPQKGIFYTLIDVPIGNFSQKITQKFHVSMKIGKNRDIFRKTLKILLRWSLEYTSW